MEQEIKVGDLVAIEYVDVRHKGVIVCEVLGIDDFEEYTLSMQLVVDVTGHENDYIDFVKEKYNSQKEILSYCTYSVNVSDCLKPLGFPARKSRDAMKDSGWECKPGCLTLSYNFRDNMTFDICVNIIAGVTEEQITIVSGYIYNDDIQSCRDLGKLLQSVEEWYVSHAKKGTEEFEWMVQRGMGKSFYTTICTAEEFAGVVWPEGVDNIVSELPFEADRFDLKALDILDTGNVFTESPRVTFGSAVRDGWYTKVVEITTEHNINYRREHAHELQSRNMLDMRDFEGLRFYNDEYVLMNIIRGKSQGHAVLPENASLFDAEFLMNRETTKYCQKTWGVCKYNTTEELKAALEEYLKDTGISIVSIRMEDWDYRRERLGNPSGVSRLLKL